jgi:hypothetical protein
MGILIRGLDHITQVEMDMFLSRPVHVHVQQHRTAGGVGHCQPRLLPAFAQNRLLGRLTSIEMSAGLHPPSETPVSVQDHPPPAHDHPRGGDMGQVGHPIEGSFQPIQFGADDLDRQGLSRIAGPVEAQLVP